VESRLVAAPARLYGVLSICASSRWPLPRAAPAAAHGCGASANLTIVWLCAAEGRRAGVAGRPRMASINWLLRIAPVPLMPGSWPAASARRGPWSPGRALAIATITVSCFLVRRRLPRSEMRSSLRRFLSTCVLVRSGTSSVPIHGRGDLPDQRVFLEVLSASRRLFSRCG
jgi:hypothetical protein